MFHLQTKAVRSAPWITLSSTDETVAGRETLHKHRRYWQHFYGHDVFTRIVSDYQLYMERMPPRPASALLTAVTLLLFGWALVTLLAVVR